MRVLHVAQPTDAGVARCVAAFAADQVRAGLDVRVACPPGGPLTAWLASAGVTPDDWPATRSPGPASAAETVRLARLVRRLAPEVVHLHSAKAGLAGRLAIRGARPTVFQPHAWSWAAVTGPVRTATLAWERFATRWTGVLVCVSDAERADGLAAGVRVRDTRVVPNGVDLTAYAPGDRSAARQRLRLPSGPLAVCVGRLSTQKGQDMLVAAWPAVRAAVPEASLVLVGDGPLALPATDGVTLAGRRDDVVDWYAAADVVVLPSRWEGMALTLLEALACGRTVVASDVAGVRECLGPGAGTLVPPGDATALAAALRAALAAPSPTGAADARAAAERFDLRRTTAAIRDVYADLLPT